MRPLHWAKLPDAKVVGTIWVDEKASGGIGLDDGGDIDTAAVEAVFGLGAAGAGGHRERAGSAAADPRTKKKAEVQLVDTKRSNNVAIALSRIRLSDDAIKAAVLDPVAYPLSSEQVTALLGVLPTSEELETIRDYSGDKESLGRVEHLFLVLSDVERLEPRLQALQASQQFAPAYETLSDEYKTVMTACEQVHTSPALKSILQRVLALGNLLNGTSARGGAYGFKLADLNKLVQVKSADNKTTLLHYLAKFLSSRSDTAIDDLKNQLNALPEAKDILIADKQSELNKLAASFKVATNQLSLCKEGDPYLPLLQAFCDAGKSQLESLQSEASATVSKLKELASWLAEKPGASTGEIFGPLAEFVKALEKAQQDNIREEEAERRRAMAPKPSIGGGRRPPGVPPGAMPSPFGPGGGDKSMMLEMQLKLAQRTEKAGEAVAGGSPGMASIKEQQKKVLGAAIASGSTKAAEGNLVDDLGGMAASGTLFAQRRAAAASAKMREGNSPTTRNSQKYSSAI